MKIKVMCPVSMCPSVTTVDELDGWIAPDRYRPTVYYCPDCLTRAGRLVEAEAIMKCHAWRDNLDAAMFAAGVDEYEVRDAMRGATFPLLLRLVKDRIDVIEMADEIIDRMREWEDEEEAHSYLVSKEFRDSIINQVGIAAQVRERYVATIDPRESPHLARFAHGMMVAQ